MGRGWHERGLPDEAVIAGPWILWSFQSSRGCISLLAALRRDRTQLLIGLDGSHQHIQQYLETKSYRTQKLSAYFTLKAHHIPSAELQEAVIQDRFQTRCDCDLVQIEEMPLLPGGEVDLRTLLEQMNAKQRLKLDFVAPRNETEQIIAAIWQELLRIDRVSIHDNFFELGGHSLLTTQLLAQHSQSLPAGLTSAQASSTRPR